MNPLSEENRRYEYVGEITKTGSFFFEVELHSGEYICLMESIYQEESRPHLLIFSEQPVQIFDRETHDKEGKKEEGKRKNA